MLAAAGRAFATRSELLMSSEKSMPTRGLHACGCRWWWWLARRCVWWTREEVREVCRESDGPGENDLFGLRRLTQCWCAPRRGELGIGNGWKRRRATRKQVQRLAVRTRNRGGRSRRARLRQRFWPSASDKTTTVLLFAAGRETARCGAPVCVSCLDRSSFALLVETVPFFVVCFSHRLLSTRSPASSSHTRGARRARAPLFVATGSVCKKVSWRLSIGWPVKCGPRRGRNVLSDFCAGERAACSH